MLDPEIREVCEAAVRKLEARGTEIIVLDDVYDEDPAIPWLMLSLTANLGVVEAAIAEGARIVGRPRSWRALFSGRCSAGRWPKPAPPPPSHHRTRPTC